MTTITTDFVPAELDATRWEHLEPLYAVLLDRPLDGPEDLERLLLDRSELDAAAAEAYANLYIDMTCHTDDEQAKNGYLRFVEDVVPKLKQTGFELDRRITACPFVDDLDGQRYAVLVRDLRADVELFREENIPLQTEDTKLDQQYSEIRGAMTVHFQDEERTLPQMAKFLEKTDRLVREAAWRAVWQRQLQDRDRVDAIFDRMIELRHQVARNAGFDNYRDYMFKAKHRFDYTPADCEAFHEAAETVCVPVLRALNAQRKDTLGVEPLRPWDLAVDVKGRDPLQPFDGADDLVERTSRLFHRMDGELAGLFDSMRNPESLDLESRKGKAPGGYQQQRDRSRTTFIFMNAAGLQRDLETMVHEAGHAFHSMLCKDDPLLHYRHSPLEFAEVASMSMEMLAYPFLDEFYGEADAARAKRGHLEDLSAMLPWIARIDAFQHWLYTHPEHTSEERTAHWLELDERFGSAVSWMGLEPYRAMSWQRQLHLFGVPFYYIEYGIAQLGALQLWTRSRRDPQSALAAYKRALRLGGSRPLPELFAAAGLELDFGPDTMKRLMDEVRSELETLPA
ncbi:MAG: M3 family oligoendopeptidase [Planctomycetota bacterium]|jgi:oligoendopeptidase F